MTVALIALSSVLAAVALVEARVLQLAARHRHTDRVRRIRRHL